MIADKEDGEVSDRVLNTSSNSGLSSSSSGIGSYNLLEPSSSSMVNSTSSVVDSTPSVVDLTSSVVDCPSSDSQSPVFSVKVEYTPASINIPLVLQSSVIPLSALESSDVFELTLPVVAGNSSDRGRF